ncbi:RagB/SusD family nutrient uptake outer membrane protein [Zunongwangia endophytica]|uniref:RagB/SusD family nutrient uptake outer membrane protein n=1 Tax=Zunongwangia endophytica TaxID=1808945 RepID=A0ABV8H6Y5_9FLAO|nr:RagB/SusD family nutrient uptake outer membrane protein [Zunongwangia endophytica]MDN3595555.1 RagB/SusD family nutrient uptake outer membrane protein [Zunongwangia endophytica]
MKLYIHKIAIILGLAILAVSCTDLDEETFGSLSPENFYNTEEEALASVAGIYQQLSYVQSIGDPWRIAEFGTDEFIVPGRASGGWFDQSNIDIMRHQVDPANATTGRAWKNIFQEIGTANAVIESLEQSPNSENLTAIIAEAKALRAYGYFYAMDFWGNVPLVTVARIDPNDLPQTTSRSEIFSFIESELLVAAEDMPSVNEVNRSDYYPRFTKESVYSLLAMMYLNAEVYTGTPQWQKAIEMCDKVINSGGYHLSGEVIDNFASNSQTNSPELISAFTNDPISNAGNNQFILYAQNALDQLKYNLPFVPANGYSTYQEALDRYGDNDARKELLEYGPQTYLNGEPLLMDNGEQLVLIPVQDLVSAEDNEGYKVLKYTPVGASFSGSNADNDYVLTRYSDILLTKAEALFRLNNNATEALNLVNEVRNRSNATSLNVLSLDIIEEERAREFIWEGHRRRDMIRFESYFNDTWAFKTTQTEEYRGIYPIPQEQITANPNLTQNPGY